MDYFIVLVALAVLFVITFNISSRRGKHDLIDITWGLGMMVSSAVSWLVGDPTALSGVMTLLVLLWGGRLAIYLADRNLGAPEDKRYTAMRARHPAGSSDLRIFARTYIVQFVLNFLIAVPVIFSNLSSHPDWHLLAWIGLALWIIGFVFQAGGDWQLRTFKTDAANKGKLLTTGLWSLTRHPNYFGESAMWWGIFLMAFNAWPQVWLAISPILITAALLKLSGVPLLEKQYQGRADWEAYAARTSMFIPMPPKRTDAR